MKTKYKENANILLKPSPFDLFGDVIVTFDDVFLWVETITRGKYIGRHFDWYVKNYYVIDKIKAAKLKHASLALYFEAANDSQY